MNIEPYLELLTVKLLKYAIHKMLGGVTSLSLLLMYCIAAEGASGPEVSRVRGRGRYVMHYRSNHLGRCDEDEGLVSA